jgi:hypothetical protein
MVVSMNYGPTPPCPKDLFQFECSVEDVDLVCFLDYSPEEKGSTDYTALPYEPDYDECMTLQSMVDHIEVSALEKFLDK